ncbi:MAG: PQQ-binding-like beta-propeller repeat protein [Bryobacteraceae bacterium]
MGKRHSPLKQITVNNAASLVPKWTTTFQGNGLRTNPIVYDGIMYVTNTNEVRAIDAGVAVCCGNTGHKVEEGSVNRGAILGDRVFFVTGDVHLVALDRRNGSLRGRSSMDGSRMDSMRLLRPRG